MTRWWIYERLKKSIKQKKEEKTKILSLTKNPKVQFYQISNLYFSTSITLKKLSCYPKVCKISRKFKKTNKMGRTTRWVFYNNLKKDKIANIFKYVW